MQQKEKKQVGTTDDLSKDMIFEGDEYKNNEGDSQSTATEGELKKPAREEAEKNETDKVNEGTNTAGSPGSHTTGNDPTHIPTLEEDESIEKSSDDISS